MPKESKKTIFVVGINLKIFTFQNVGFTLFKPLASYSLSTPAPFEWWLIIDFGWCLGPAIPVLSILFLLYLQIGIYLFMSTVNLVKLSSFS